MISPHPSPRLIIEIPDAEHSELPRIVNFFVTIVVERLVEDRNVYPVVKRIVFSEPYGEERANALHFLISVERRRRYSPLVLWLSILAVAVAAVVESKELYVCDLSWFGISTF